MERIGVFAYGSLVDRASAAATLERDVGSVWPARLEGWRRRFSQARRNELVEKTFARGDGTIPPWVLGLNLEPGEDAGQAPNGGLIEVTASELDRLDVREIRYDRVEVTERVATGGGAPAFDRVIAYVAKRAHLAPDPPPGSVIIRAYAETVERAFAGLGGRELEEYRRTTLPYPVELVEGVLVRDEIPPGNPRRW